MSRPPRFGITGFTVGRNSASLNRGNAIPPPRNSGYSKQGYSTMDSINNYACTSYGLPKKRALTEEEYFENDEEVSNPPLEYIPAPGSPTYVAPRSDSDSDEEDPLDAFMAGIADQVKLDMKTAGTGKSNSSTSDKNKAGVRGDIEEEDNEESYYRYMEENPRAGMQDDDSDVEIEYDEDGNPIAPKKSKYIDPLPPIDHSTIKYDDVVKNFYVVHDEIANLTGEQVDSLRQTLGIKVIGMDPPHAVTSFAHFNFDESLMKAIRKAQYTQPTPIQAQAVPAALSGRDIIGIAKTGSGKTVAFLWPMLVHIMDQRELTDGEGPIGLILAPTRELSQQIYVEAKRFGKVYNIQVVCCYGGGSKYEQSKALESGAEIVVATPGRLIDLIKMKATNLARVSFLVLDEADRMFDLGFEPQVRSICDHVRPDRQTLLFSATFRKKVEKLARHALTDPIKIVQGDIGEANEDVIQKVHIVKQDGKFRWLTSNLVSFLSEGSVLVFVTKKLEAEELAQSLTVKEYDLLLLHGDMDQIERNSVITKFKKQEVNILIATDVAARGLDIPHIRNVVNYDVARDIDTHTHRIGRTGRAGQKGTAYTLVTEKDKEFAGHLVRNLESVNQEVPKALLDLAMQSSWFNKSRYKGGRGKNVNVGGAGLGFKARSAKKNFAESANQSEFDNMIKAASTRTGPGSERLTALKQAFRSQYQTQFKPSEDHTWEQTTSNQCGEEFAKPAQYGTPTSQQLPIPPSKTKSKKSRWE